jgi:predicted  nucleic acid-binding Zn-ribbon protein
MSEKHHKKILKLEKQAYDINNQISQKQEELVKIRKKITKLKLELKKHSIYK